MISVQKVAGPNMVIDFIKNRPQLAWLFCFWLICAGTALLVTKWPRPDVDGRYKVKMLNFYRPDHYRPLTEALEHGQPVPGNYLKYHELAAEYLPTDFAAQYMFALCAHSRGDYAQAAAAYRRAIDINPYFFWGYYNFGILCWTTGQPETARRLWAAGTKIPPELVLKALVSTKLLADCLGDHDPTVSLRKAYADALRWAQGQTPTQWLLSLY